MKFIVELDLDSFTTKSDDIIYDIGCALESLSIDLINCDDDIPVNLLDLPIQKIEFFEKTIGTWRIE